MGWPRTVFLSSVILTTYLLQCAALSVLPLWDTTVRHALKDDVVRVEFVPADVEYNYSRYRVEFWFVSSKNTTDGHRRCDGAFGCRLRSFNVSAEWPVVQKRIKNTGPAGNYCLRVSPLGPEEGGSCESGCLAVASKIFFLQGNAKLNSDEYDCGTDRCKWDVVISLDLQIPKKTAVITYNVANNTSECIHSFFIELWYEVTHRCDGGTGNLLNYTTSSKRSNTLAFQDLMPGNYCVRISPYRRTCRGECETLHSRIEDLLPSSLAEEVPAVALLAAESERSSSVWLYPTILGALFLGLLALGFGVFLRRWRRILNKTRVSNQVDLKESNDNQGDLQVQLKETKWKDGDPARNVSVVEEEVVVLYSHDSKLEREGAGLLVDFLKDCCGLSVCTALGDLPLIGVSPERWIEKKLLTGKVVIVQSDREHPILDRQCSSDGLLDQVFDNSLSFLYSRKNSLIDYGRLFVVRFTQEQEPASDNLKMVVPNIRYVLSGDLPDLYARLIEARDAPDLRREVLPVWQCHPSYSRLCDFCSRV